MSAAKRRTHSALERGELARLLRQSRRLVIKLGTVLLMDERSEEARLDWLKSLAQDLDALKRRKQEVVLVSSGAVALGWNSLGLAHKARALELCQAAAAAGQMALMRAWSDALAPLRWPVAQILLTLEDTEQRRRYLNARSTISTLLRCGVLPIINENDTVATEELRYGDNDRLAARVAAMLAADALILFSDVEGLYAKAPQARPSQARRQEKARRDQAPSLIPLVERITPAIKAMADLRSADLRPSAHGRGGMAAKLEAAQIAMQAGCHMVLADGRAPHPLQALEQTGARATLFRAPVSPHTARQNWIAGGLHPRGSVTIDAGAGRALRAGKSLLPIGATAIAGLFQRGDNLRILNADGEEIARGLAAWSSAEAQQMLGKNSRAIAELFGVRGREELVHRDDLVMMKDQP